MDKQKMRRQQRYESVNLLSYVCLDSEGKEWKQGMGRSLNINETGVKLETHEPIETQYIVLLAIGIEDEVVDIKGQVVYCNRGESGRFESGIEFCEMDSDSLVVLRKFVQEFNRKYE
ncbi:MAG: PilZ domain-containing protein [Desulfobacteraceae bacterium]|nr:PilZ domain-containing protein [Desulfobacteraceae bacterium]